MLAHQRLLLSLNVPIFLKCPNPILMTLLKCILVPILSFAPPLTHVLCLMHTLLLSLTQLIVPFWIIDSGATDHITCSFNDFLSFSKIQPMRIHLPNCSVIAAHISGTVQLSPHFIIHDVLYVPNFKFNLISISKLLSSLKYTLTFSNSHCQIQEMKSLKMIRLAKLKHGLYHLQINKDVNQAIPKVSFINNFSTPPITKTNLWHFRLAYLSGKRLNVLHSIFPCISKHVEENCDVCHLAKQKKLSYSPLLQ